MQQRAAVAAALVVAGVMGTLALTAAVSVVRQARSEMRLAAGEKLAAQYDAYEPLPNLPGRAVVARSLAPRPAPSRPARRRTSTPSTRRAA